MSGLLRVENEILVDNHFGAFFVGPDKNNLLRVTKTGLYPARRGSVTQHIFIEFKKPESGSFIEAILPRAYTLFIRAADFMDSQTTEEELLGKDSGFNIGAYQIESIAANGIQKHIGGRVRMFSLEAAEESLRFAKRQGFSKR